MVLDTASDSKSSRSRMFFSSTGMFFKSRKEGHCRSRDLARRSSSLALRDLHCLSDRSIHTPTSTDRQIIYATNATVHLLSIWADISVLAASWAGSPPLLGDILFPCLLEKDDCVCRGGADPRSLSDSPEVPKRNRLFFFLSATLVPDAAVRIGDTHRAFVGDSDTCFGDPELKG